MLPQDSACEFGPETFTSEPRSERGSRPCVPRLSLEPGEPVHRHPTTQAQVLGAIDLAHKARWPALNRALVRPDSAQAGDLASIARFLEMVSLHPRNGSADVALFAINQWFEVFAADLHDDDTIRVWSFNEALSPLGARIVMLDGAWCYNNGIGHSLANHVGSSIWSNLAFLEWMSNGFVETCGDENINEGMSFRVIDGGRRFLRDNPGSSIAAEVDLSIAQAHETIWCLARTPATSGDGSKDFRRIWSEGPSHRTRAIALYESYLRARPNSPFASAIRRRLNRLRNSIDTGYYKYWFPGD